MIQGVYTALVTPFLPDESVDEEGLRTLLAYQMWAEIDGITLLGTTGESPALSYDERDRIMQIAVEETQGKTPLMIGCGTYSTQKTIQMATHAKKCGATSLLIVTPYYVKPTQEGIFQHFKAITEAVDLPICVYNIQGRCGVNIETDTLARLAELPTVVSVKEASGSIMQMSDVIERIHLKRSHFSVMCGDDALTLPLMALGGHGIISVISNLVPRAVRQFVHACRTNMQAARELHFLLRPLNHIAFIEANPIPIKRLLQLAHFPAGRCRLPLVELLPHNNAKVQELYNNLPQILCQEIQDFQKLQRATSSKKFESADALSKSSILT